MEAARAACAAFRGFTANGAPPAAVCAAWSASATAASAIAAGAWPAEAACWAASHAAWSAEGAAWGLAPSKLDLPALIRQAITDEARLDRADRTGAAKGD